MAELKDQPLEDYNKIIPTNEFTTYGAPENIVPFDVYMGFNNAPTSSTEIKQEEFEMASTSGARRKLICNEVGCRLERFVRRNGRLPEIDNDQKYDDEQHSIPVNTEEFDASEEELPVRKYKKKKQIVKKKIVRKNGKAKRGRPKGSLGRKSLW